MTPQQKAESGIFQLQEAVLAILEEAPEEELKADTIRERLGIPPHKTDRKPPRSSFLKGGRRLIEGILAKLETEGLVQEVAGSGDRHWKLKQ